MSGNHKVNPEPAGSKGLCNRVNPVSLSPFSTIPKVAVEPREVDAKMAKPDVKVSKLVKKSKI